jgi:phosphoribosylcarboxyaminoimidazole (NCAIR) mutase
VQILAVSDGGLSEKMKQYKTGMAAAVKQKDADLQGKLDELLK